MDGDIDQFIDAFLQAQWKGLPTGSDDSDENMQKLAFFQVPAVDFAVDKFIKFFKNSVFVLVFCCPFFSFADDWVLASTDRSWQKKQKLKCKKQKATLRDVVY